MIVGSMKPEANQDQHDQAKAIGFLLTYFWIVLAIPCRRIFVTLSTYPRSQKETET
ncbi:MAG TPA: hypothetical protein VN366_06745 [Feifaniaceae bacterium]|nr:hypothetical protein [Feifaniaceae bacterium]